MMKAGIIIHSQTGRTALVASKIAAAFEKRGVSTDTHVLRAEGNVRPRSTAFEIKSPPSVDNYDLLVFGAPVWAFDVSPVMKKYLGMAGSGTLSGKKVAGFVTKGLPFGWTGGTQALASMKKALAAAGADVRCAEMLPDFRLRDEKTVQQTVDRIVAALRA
jgi:NAD(P)H dehydrogenase (quinone)